MIVFCLMQTSGNSTHKTGLKSVSEHSLFIL